MRLIKPDQWRPVDINDLEPAAWEALRHPTSVYVVAGPGAGKTEFLAQRAAYLLQTGLCPQPSRILAISFKTDAADNLNKRVRKRCAPEHAVRFASMTFDSFTKGLVDRFWGAIPPNWRPTRDYDISFPTFRDYNDFLNRTRLGAPKGLQSEIIAVNAAHFEPRILGQFRLPKDSIDETTSNSLLVSRWLTETLSRRPKSLLTFTELNRLAEFLLRARPEILTALRYTYPFVFIDEFQDTTFAQYDFLQSVFGGGDTIITVVGDEKQRIMAWAGARRDGFSRFKRDFHAKRFELLFNFRSSPGLVQIQHVIARALDPKVATTESKADPLISEEVAKIWKCTFEEAEASHLADWLAKDIVGRGLKPRDYALIVRQTADKFEAKLSPALEAAGIKVRNEAKLIGRLSLQDLLTEEVARIAISIMRLGAVRRSPSAWAVASEAVHQLRKVDPDNEVGLQRSEKELVSFLGDLRSKMEATPPDESVAKQVCGLVFEFMNLTDVARAFVEYQSGEALEISVEGITNHFSSSAVGATTWTECVDAFEGVDQVPLMTVHKSKGLEYDTIIFVGLDDKMWWSYDAKNPEGLATFFVALSRAKQRAIFTFCQARGDRKKIADLYQLLSDAGVQEEDVEGGQTGVDTF